MRRSVAYPALAALLLTLALAGCRREPLPASGEPIRFTVSPAGVSSAPTKTDLPAVAAPADRLDRDENTVRVWGTYQEGSAPEANVFAEPYLVLTCSGMGASASWSYDSGRYYWNRSASYKFRSVFTDRHDVDIQNGSSVNSVSVNYSGGYDLMVSGITVPAADQQSANLRFMHACSAVRFYCVDPYRGNGAPKNYISTFRLTNISATGTLVYDGNSSSSTAVLTGWTSIGTPGDVTDTKVTLPWGVPDINVEDTEDAALTPWFYFVPQTLGSDTHIQFSITAGDHTVVVDRPLNEGSLPDAWVAGQKYTYFIVIQPTISFDFTVTPWNETPVNGKYIVR